MAEDRSVTVMPPPTTIKICPGVPESYHMPFDPVFRGGSSKLYWSGTVEVPPIDWKELVPL